MTNPSALEIAAYGAAAATVLGGIAQLVVSVITVFKVGKIEAHVNSEKTAAEGREAHGVMEAKMLREMLEERKHTAELLAQAAAQRQRPVARELTAETGPVQVEVINTPNAPVPTMSTDSPQSEEAQPDAPVPVQIVGQPVGVQIASKP